VDLGAVLDTLITDGSSQLRRGTAATWHFDLETILAAMPRIIAGRHD
jgi:hypothetical protein